MFYSNLIAEKHRIGGWNLFKRESREEPFRQRCTYRVIYARENVSTKSFVEHSILCRTGWADEFIYKLIKK